MLDETTLAIPDRLGNHRLDTFDNVLTHPEIGLLFMIPGNGDTLRVSGKGKLCATVFLQYRFSMNGNSPNLVLVVTVEQAFMHCPKCVVRSRLWTPGEWPDHSNVPTLAEAIMAHAKPAETAAEVRAISRITTRTYTEFAPQVCYVVDIVAKVFLGDERKSPELLMRFNSPHVCSTISVSAKNRLRTSG